MAQLNTQWARNGLSADEACCITFSPTSLPLVTNVGRLDAGLGILAGLAEKVGIDVEVVGLEPLVYFARSADRIKIGKTTNLLTRVAQLRRQHPDLEIDGVIYTLDHSRLERQLHKQFKHIRIEGEWFHATAELITSARELHDVREWCASVAHEERTAVAECVHVRWVKFAEFQRYQERDKKVASRNEGESAHAPASAPASAKKEPPKPPARAGGSEGGKAVRRNPHTERADALWPRLVEESARVARAWSEKPRKQYRDAIVKALKAGYSEDDLTAALRGWISRQPEDKRSDSDHIRAYFNPGTIFKISGLAQNVDAGSQGGNVSPLDAAVARQREARRKMYGGTA
jgi:hypothetical protein